MGRVPENVRRRLMKKRKNNGEDRYGTARNIGYAITIPGMLFGCIMAGVLIGYYLDKWLETTPWMLLLFLMFGIIAGIRETLAILRRLNSDKDV